MISELQPHEPEISQQQQEGDEYMHEVVESPPPLPTLTPLNDTSNTITTNSTGDIEDAGIITCRNAGINSNTNEGDNLLKYLTLGEITKIFNNSSSRQTFATTCVKYLFPEDIQLKSNVNGKAGKERLDPDKVGCCLSLSGTETSKAARAECVKAIDGSSRHIKHSIKKKL